LRTLIFVIVVLAAIGVGVYSLLASPAVGPKKSVAACTAGGIGACGSSATGTPACCGGASGSGTVAAAGDSARAPLVPANPDSGGMFAPGSRGF
jgi:hypothetical protein